MATRTPDARAKGLLSWLILAVAVVMAAFTVAILVAAVQVDGVGEVTGTLVAGGIATLVAVVAFVDQRRKVRATREAELAAGSRADAAAPASAAPDAAAPGDDAVSR
jgi:preprotein translocase subunit SecY